MGAVTRIRRLLALSLDNIDVDLKRKAARQGFETDGIVVA
jgi:hypothetical protein